MNVQQIMEDVTTDVIIQKEISTVLANMDINLIMMVTHAFINTILLLNHHTPVVHHHTPHRTEVRRTRHHTSVVHHHILLLACLPTLQDMALLPILQSEHQPTSNLPTNQDIIVWVKSGTFLFSCCFYHYCWLVVQFLAFNYCCLLNVLLLHYT